MVGLGFCGFDEVNMAVLTSWWRMGATALVLAGLLGLGLGCHHSDYSVSSYTMTGTVTYTQVPLNFTSDGVPTGLQTDPNLFVATPARGVVVRVYQSWPQIDVYGNVTTAWVLAGSGVTDGNGYYDIGGLTLDQPTFVELDSVSSVSGTVRLVGDPAGIDSLVPEPGRVIYAMRKGADGSTSTTSPTPGTILGGNSVVNFSVGRNDPWLLTPLSWNVPSTGPFAYPPTVAAGSRVLAILDDVYFFASNYGTVIPGNTLDLHYHPAVRSPRGSFVEYNRSLYPLSFDGAAYHYFGSIAGSLTLNGVTYPDDADYQGVIWTLLARNNLYVQNQSVLYPTGHALTDLTPPMAVLEGLALEMAAGLLHSPYLPDTSLPARYPPVDIRVPSAVQTACSAPNIAGLAWDLNLITNGIARPGTQATWATLYPSYMDRLYQLARPTVAVGSLNVYNDVDSIYSQVATLEFGQTSTEYINLPQLFTDASLTTLLATYNLPWTNANSYPRFTTNLGMDPDSRVSKLPSFTLSMAKAQQVPLYLPGQAATLAYPNQSNEEVYYASFTASQDHAYNLGVTTVPPIPDGALIEVTVDPAPVSGGIYFYGGSNPATNAIVVSGNYNDLTNPAWHSLQVRIVSPTILQPDLKVTLEMEITSSSDPSVSPVSTGS